MAKTELIPELVRLLAGTATDYRSAHRAELPYEVDVALRVLIFLPQNLKKDGPEFSAGVLSGVGLMLPVCFLKDVFFQVETSLRGQNPSPGANITNAIDMIRSKTKEAV